MPLKKENKMAVQKISPLRAAALLTATANNRFDWEDSKKSFLQKLEMELRKGGNRQLIYQDAIKGLLLEGLDDKNVDKVLSEANIYQHAVSMANRLQKLYFWSKWALIPGVLLSLGVGILTGIGLALLL